MASWESEEHRIFGELGSGLSQEESRLRLECLKRSFNYIRDYPKFRQYIDALNKAINNNDKSISWTTEYLDHSQFSQIYGLNPAVLGNLSIESLDLLEPGTPLPETMPSDLINIFDAQPVAEWIHDERSWLWGADALLDRIPDGEQVREKLAALPLENRAKEGVWQRTLENHQQLLLIDLRFDRRDILRGVEKYLDFLASTARWQETRKRFRQEAWQCLKVWDLRESKMSFKTIGATLGITRAAALKRFYRAYELTQGRPFTAETRKTYEDEPVAQSPCEACDDRASCKKESCDKLNHFLPKVFLFDRKSVPLKDLSNGDDDDDTGFYLSE